MLYKCVRENPSHANKLIYEIILKREQSQIARTFPSITDATNPSIQNCMQSLHATKLLVNGSLFK